MIQFEISKERTVKAVKREYDQGVALSIEDRYAVDEYVVAPCNGVWVWICTDSTRNDQRERVYHVTLAPEERCTCPGHVHHGHCKHVEIMEKLL